MNRICSWSPCLRHLLISPEKCGRERRRRNKKKTEFGENVVKYAQGLKVMRPLNYTLFRGSQTFIKDGGKKGLYFPTSGGKIHQDIEERLGFMGEASQRGKGSLHFPFLPNGAIPINSTSL